MKGRAIGKKSQRSVRIRPNLVLEADGFAQKELELHRKYPDWQDFITHRIAQERERANGGLTPKLDGIEDEVRMLRKQRKYSSGKGRGKRL